ncbi:Protein-L-isoaspartate O-methyltransferase domain-containing protein 1 [Papilio xuthus]|uniref:Protein-L-isoaspartate O-methyltransferase domain-containing protein 1 n=1 Tax=Papilio xuthus TaxID=66420 RepID=A0A194Q4C8_PAPXU|nr:Protein-L-isoaspartate O-methyltransferase domain-containing protein 1 [Papilio xuthus]
MGGAVSSGRNNNELVDNLMEASYIRTPEVERVFRAVDRGNYMLPGDRDRAYRDIAWRNGFLHLSSPCIYSEVMEGLEFKAGQSFLNIGSGTGYLSTMVGLVLGSGGISHGVEIYPKVLDYAVMMQKRFIERSSSLDDFDFCEPKFFHGNGLCLAPLPAAYDRVYCGAACPEEYALYLKQLIRIGGILVMPLNDTLVQVRRLGAREWATRSLLNVSFAPLQLPNEDDAAHARQTVTLEEQAPPALQVQHRGVLSRHPELREEVRMPPLRRPRIARHARRCPRRLCIPIREDRVHNFNALHDLGREDGANEMNALLSLVLSMGENRVAGALRFDPVSDNSNSASSTDDSTESESEWEPAAENSRAPQNRIRVGSRNSIGNAGAPRGRRDASSQFPVDVEFYEDVADVGETPPTPPPRPAARQTPADVDLHLEDAEHQRGLSASDMKWEESRTASRREPSSDDDTESASKGSEEKRQKLDSGIGEGNSPSSSSQGKTERSAASDTGEASDDTEPPLADGRRRQKRLRTLAPSSSTEEESSEFEGELRRRAARRAGGVAAEGAASDVRRHRRARLLRHAINNLPLPQQLKVYVNWGRALPV